MAKKLPELSIFFPLWNEEENVESVVSQALSIAPQIAERFEVIVVDDGSSDSTRKIAEQIAEKNKNVRVVSHQPNRGYGAALKEGFANSRFAYIVFMDGDRQFDFSEVVNFIPEIEHSDIVIGFRRKRRDQKILKRLLLMNLLRAGDFVLFGFHFKDIDCGFKMFRREAVEAISPLRSEGAMISTEILAKAKLRKLKIAQVGVTHYKREHGIQTGANFPVVVRAILESLTLWLDIKNKRF